MMSKGSAKAQAERKTAEPLEEKSQEEEELDGKGDQVGDDDGDGHDQAREVDLAEEMRVLDEGLGGAGEAVGEIAPEHRAGHVKEHGRETVRGKAGDAAEHDGKDKRVQDGLNDEPKRTEDGLLVTGDEIPADKHADQVAVAPDIAQLQVVPFFAGGDN